MKSEMVQIFAPNQAKKRMPVFEIIWFKPQKITSKKSFLFFFINQVALPW